MLELFKSIKGLGLRCPNCGQGALSRYFWVFRESCTGCGYTFLGQTGDFWGGVVFTYLVAGGSGISVTALLYSQGWHSITGLTLSAVGTAITTALVTFPFFKGVWIHLVHQARAHNPEYQPKQ